MPRAGLGLLSAGVWLPGQICRPGHLGQLSHAAGICNRRDSRGRDAGYPAPPAQTRMCSFTASGSSVALAFAQEMVVFNHP